LIIFGFGHFIRKNLGTKIDSSLKFWLLKTSSPVNIGGVIFTNQAEGVFNGGFKLLTRREADNVLGA
jgi:hypothetical protein